MVDELHYSNDVVEVPPVPRGKEVDPLGNEVVSNMGELEVDSSGRSVT